MGGRNGRWRHLDRMQLETVIVAKVLRLLDPQSGQTQTASVPWATKGSRGTMFNVAVDKVRRAEHKRNQRAEDETLRGSRQLWLYGL